MEAPPPGCSHGNVRGPDELETEPRRRIATMSGGLRQLAPRGDDVASPVNDHP